MKKKWIQFFFLLLFIVVPSYSFAATSTTTCSYTNPWVAASGAGIVPPYQIYQDVPQGSVAGYGAVSGGPGVSLQFASSTCVTVSDASGGGGSVTFPSVFQVDNIGFNLFAGFVVFFGVPFAGKVPIQELS